MSRYYNFSLTLGLLSNIYEDTYEILFLIYRSKGNTKFQNGRLLVINSDGMQKYHSSIKDWRNVPWRWRHLASLIHLWTPIRLRGVISIKHARPIFIKPLIYQINKKATEVIPQKKQYLKVVIFLCA
jgi:hypothetical protein